MEHTVKGAVNQIMQVQSEYHSRTKKVGRERQRNALSSRCRAATVTGSKNKVGVFMQRSVQEVLPKKDRIRACAFARNRRGKKANGWPAHKRLEKEHLHCKYIFEQD